MLLCEVHCCCCCCCSFAKSCLTLCDPLYCSPPSFPVLEMVLPELAQTHVHWVSDAIQPSHPLLPPFSPALNLSQPQGLFQWVRSLLQVAQSIGASASASVLPRNIGLISLRFHLWSLYGSVSFLDMVQSWAPTMCTQSILLQAANSPISSTSFQHFLYLLTFP